MMALHSFISEVEPIDISLPVLDTKLRAETAVPSQQQRLGLYEGKEPLVCRRSTVSFQSSMSLGNHQDGITRCLSAPGTLLQQQQQQQQRPAYLASISRDKETSNGLEVVASCPARDNRDLGNALKSGEILADGGGDYFEMRVTDSHPMIVTAAAEDVLPAYRELDRRPLVEAMMSEGDSKLWTSSTSEALPPPPSSLSKWRVTIEPNGQTLGLDGDIDREIDIAQHDQHFSSSTASKDIFTGVNSGEVSRFREIAKEIDSGIGSTDQSDAGTLTPVEVQAMGPLVPVYVASYKEKTNYSRSSRNSLGQEGGVEEYRSWREVARRVWHRGEKSSSPSPVKQLAGRNTLRKAARSTKRPASKVPGGFDSHSAGTKKGSSLFIHFWNGSVRHHHHPSHAGYDKVRSTSGASYLAASIRKKVSLFSMKTHRDIGSYSPELISELSRYFGSDNVRWQLLGPSLKRKKDAVVQAHHPINRFMLARRYAKQEREIKFQGRQLPRTRKSYLSLSASRLRSSSQIRIINRHREPWRLLEFSKIADTKIGSGELSLADFLSTSVTLRRDTTRRSHPSLQFMGNNRLIPTRTSSKHVQRVSTPKAVRRVSTASTIGWAESIKEFEGALGFVRITGERELSVRNDETTISGRSSWGYFSPDQLPHVDDNRNRILGEAPRGTRTETTTALTENDVPFRPSYAEESKEEGEPESDLRTVVVSGQWIEALQLMQEYEAQTQQAQAETERKSKEKIVPSIIRRRSSRCTSTSSPEGHVDEELREACRLALMSAGVLESRKRTSSTLNPTAEQSMLGLERYI